ncbi:uncharacterized protein [Aquarana catesbeiana]|uniref:uncharacterized protein n=1 Tax=Aquarana catesbeiana TaxID=8400 RepID=UPI003CC9B206
MNFNRRTSKDHQDGSSHFTGFVTTYAAADLLKYRVGIFSRSEIIDYSWIRDLLQSDHFRSHVSDVRHYDIRDSGKSSFGILYFTKKKEQINEKYVTDVQQIQRHRSHLGKDNVIIVMDDVEDSSDQKKIRILESHPDIKDLYHNLFLFSPQEKSSEYKTLLSSLMNINKPPQPQAEKAGPVEGMSSYAETGKQDDLLEENRVQNQAEGQTRDQLIQSGCGMVSWETQGKSRSQAEGQGKETGGKSGSQAKGQTQEIGGIRWQAKSQVQEKSREVSSNPDHNR